MCVCVGKRGRKNVLLGRVKSINTTLIVPYIGIWSFGVFGVYLLYVKNGPGYM